MPPSMRCARHVPVNAVCTPCPPIFPDCRGIATAARIGPARCRAASPWPGNRERILPDSPRSNPSSASRSTEALRCRAPDATAPLGRSPRPSSSHSATAGIRAGSDRSRPSPSKPKAFPLILQDLPPEHIIRAQYTPGVPMKPQGSVRRPVGRHLRHSWPFPPASAKFHGKEVGTAQARHSERGHRAS